MSNPHSNFTPETDQALGMSMGGRTNYQVPVPTTRATTPLAFAGQTRTLQPSNALGSFDIIMLLKALRRRWVLALTIGLIFGGLVGTVAWNVVPSAKYTARATLQVLQHSPKVIFETGQKEADFSVFQKTQIEFLRSTRVIGAVMRDPDVARLQMVKEDAEDDQNEWLREMIKVNFSVNSEILEIAISGDHAPDLVVLVDKVVESYMRNVVEEERAKRFKRLEKLRKLWDTYQSELKQKRQSLRALAEAAGSTDKETLIFQHQNTIDNLNTAVRQRAEIVDQIRRLEMAVKLAEMTQGSSSAAQQGEMVTEVTPEQIEDALNNDLNIEKMRAEERRLTAKVTRHKGVVRNHDDPVIREAKKELQSIQFALRDYIEKARPKLERQLKSVGQPATTDDGSKLSHAKASLQLLKENLPAYEREIAELRKIAATQNKNTTDVTQEQEEIALVAHTSNKVGAEVEAIEVELSAPERVTVINKAELPRKRDDLKRLRVIGAAAGGAFLMALFGVSFWEFRARRINSVDEVVQNLGLNLVGALPAMPIRPRRKLGGPASKSLEERWQKLLVESVDAMRTMLLHTSRVESLRAIMITSASQGEGKTSLAGHLATSLARAGRRTLLVDCDIRRPTIHRLFDEPIDPGLCEVLRGEISAIDAIRQGPTTELSLITAGRYDALAQQILGQDRVREVLEQWKQEFEFVIIDTPPVLPVADSLFLSQHVDGVLFAILREVSRVPQVQAAYERMSRLGVRMLGAVVNGAESDPHSYGSVYYSSTALPE